MQLQDLNSKDRRRLLRFVCSFAWADLEVVDSERAMLGRLIKKMGLDDEEAEEVAGWIARPPDPDMIDPQDIPSAHRQLFLDTVTAMILADGRVADGEAENLDLLRQMIG
jgi:uncharacterized membrane protein YebE (DUF533 family)